MSEEQIPGIRKVGRSQYVYDKDPALHPEEIEILKAVLEGYQPLSDPELCDIELLDLLENVCVKEGIEDGNLVAYSIVYFNDRCLP